MTKESERAYLADVERRVAQSWPATLPRTPRYPWGQVPLTEYVRAWARTRPHATALVFYERCMTFGELNRWSEGLAAWLAERGVGRRDRVAVCLPSCPQFTIAFLGILKAGAIVVPVNPMAREAEIRHFLMDSGAKCAIVQDSLVPVVCAAARGLALGRPLVTAVSDFLPASTSLRVPAGLEACRLALEGVEDFCRAIETAAGTTPEVKWDDFAVLNYTGGTTGLPKGCIHTHGDLVYTGACGATFAYPEGTAVILNFLPMFWIAGEVGGLLIPLVAGSMVVLLARWDAETVMDSLERYRVTATTLTVDGAVEIVEHPGVGNCDLTSLRHTHGLSFTKVITLDYRARWKAATGSILRESSWGMTETNTCDTFTSGFQEGDFDLLQPRSFVGLPMPGTQFKIIDAESEALMPLGQEGELCVRTPSLLKGYWNQPEATAQALRDGWLRTGDTALIDERGFLIFRGRRKEMLKVNGMSVFPAEVEALLMQHPSIAACGVTGRPDEAKGQVPVAFIRLREGAHESRETLDAWCRLHIAVYKLPEIRIVTELPMTATGKVKRAELEKLV